METWGKDSVSQNESKSCLNLRLPPAKGLLPGWHWGQLHKDGIFSIILERATWKVPLQTTLILTGSHRYMAMSATTLHALCLWVETLLHAFLLQMSLKFSYAIYKVGSGLGKQILTPNLFHLGYFPRPWAKWSQISLSSVFPPIVSYLNSGLRNWKKRTWLPLFFKK